tara:strand:- start:469 stop:5004 length:4536 start_codon:yes stop_codon:yes gene_type:complete
MSYSQSNKSRPPVRNYNKQPAQQQQQSSITSTPETFILECNRQTSLTKSDSTYTRWTTETGNGGFQIKEGDAITITNSFLSSIGTGNLIGWDNIEGSDSQDNRGCWIFSFYGCNDGLNDKREGYNMLDNPTGEGVNQKHTGGIGRFPYDTDNSACPLIRVQKSNDVITGNSSREHTDSHAGNTFSWIQDPYMKGRFFGETFFFQPVILDNHIQVEIVIDLQSGYAPNIVNLGTCLKFYQYTSNNTKVMLDPRKFLGRGSSIRLKAQDESFIPDNPSQFNNKDYEFVFTIFDVINRTGADTGYYARVEDQGNIIPESGTTPYAGEERSITCRIYVLPLGGRMSYGTTGTEPIAYYGTLLPKEKYIENGDKLYMMKQYGLSMIDIVDNNTSRQYGNIINDTNTKNIPLSINVISSPTSQESLKLPITILEYNSAGNLPTRFQNITFRFNSTQTNNTINTPVLFRDFFSCCSMIICIDDLDGNLQEQINFYLWKISDTDYSLNFITHTDGKPAIQLTGCLRGVNLHLNNYTTNGQPTTNIITQDNSEGTTAYFVMLNKYFTSYTCSYADEVEQQYQSTSIDYSPTLTATRDITPYFGFMKLTDSQLLQLVAGSNTIHYFKNKTNTNIYNSFGDISITNNIDSLDYIPLCYSGFQNITQAQQNVKHYQQFEFKIEENYSSPADIGTELTKQTHQIGNIIDKDGIDKGLANSGLIQNNFFIPVWTSANDSNIENNSKELGGILDTGSFFLDYTLYKSSNNIIRASFDPNNIELTYANADDYKIYFRTKYTCMNKPTAGNTTTDGNRDFLQVPRNGINPTLANVRYAITYGSNPTPVETTPATIRNGAIGFPIEYSPNCFVSQYCGANNISFSWDDSNSRFNLDYLHQPAISKFEATSSGVVQDGGNIISTIYYPTPIGGFSNDYLYKLPRTRVGGINIENWVSYNFENIKTPAHLRSQFNIPLTQSLDGEWFLYNDKTTDVNYDIVSNRFWNKLGFTDNQILETNVGFTKDGTTGRYTPLGTTDNRITVADGLITAKEPAENTPRFDSSNSYDGGATAEIAQYEYSSFGSLEFNNHLTGYGLPNSSGVPLSFRPNSTAFNAYESTYNPDRERTTAYTFETIGQSLQASTLPTKTEYPYFFVMSDIVETNFYTSINQGSKLNVIGIISKLNAEQDFYFTYQSPLTFYASKDKIISQITTEIRTPDLKEPSAISPYSSVIYTITRMTPTPVQISPPIWFQQEQYFNNINNIANMVSKQPEPSKVKQIQALITLLGQEALQPTADYSSTTDQLVNKINTLDLSRFRNNPRGLRMFLENDPIGQDVLTSLNTYTRFQPSAPSIMGGTQPTAQNILNQYSQAPIRQNPPADEENLSFMGTRIQDLPSRSQQAQPTQDDIYRQIIDSATELGRLGASPMNDNDIRQLAGAGISEELLQGLREVAQQTYRSQMFRDMPKEPLNPTFEQNIGMTSLPTTREGIKQFSDSGVGSSVPQTADDLITESGFRTLESIDEEQNLSDED